MKKIKDVIFLFLFSAALIFQSCGERKTEVNNSKKAEVDPPEQIISIEEAQGMYKNYSERRVPLIQKYEDSVNMSQKNDGKFDVARYTYYDYKTIKQYLEYIEQEAAKAGVEISTLRFYYSNYPEEGTFADGSKVVHPRQNSFFIQPTLSENGEEYGFYTEDGGDDGKKRAVLLNGQMQLFGPDGAGVRVGNNTKSYAGFIGPNTSAPAATSSYSNGSLVLNHGGAAPPPYQ
ncbi:MAG: hypothetical protein ABF293_05765 [Flavobacteriaceae bacterium]